MKLVLLTLILACSAPAPVMPRHGEGIAALPPQAPVDTGRFSGIVVCARCHAANERAMRDASGADVSPVADVAASMMGLAARDPYYLAALRRELHAHPGARDQILALCVRCHAPVGFAEAAATGGSLGLGQLETSTEAAGALGREGVACAGCHAMVPDGLGDEATFVGQVALRTDRVSYGALAEPLDETMRQMVKARVIPSAHVSQSELCASCHTVLVHSLGGGPELPEQTTFLEWRDSAYRESQTCQHCHMPSGAPTPFATRPPDAPVRDGYRRHAIRGGNAYLLSRLADHVEWLGAPVTADALAAAARDTEAMLGQAASLELVVAGDEVRVTVVNRTGHKLPTGYPTRRMWLHVRAVDAAGRVVLESGRHERGAIHGALGRIDPHGAILPHRTRIAASDDVQIWEAVPVDASGARTHVLLGATRFAKDDRILPAGWRDDHADAPRTRPIGVVDDADFAAGRDVVTYVTPNVARVDVELLYQAIPPETLESYHPDDNPEAARFLAIADRPPEPEVLARAAWSR